VTEVAPSTFVIAPYCDRLAIHIAVVVQQRVVWDDDIGPTSATDVGDDMIIAHDRCVIGSSRRRRNQSCCLPYPVAGSTRTKPRTCC